MSEHANKEPLDHKGEDEKAKVNNFTFLAIFTPEIIKNKTEIRKHKFYAFNTSSRIQKNDFLETNYYDTPLQVIETLDRMYQYVNIESGELSNEVNSTKQRKLAHLEIDNEANEETIFAKKLNISIL